MKAVELKKSYNPKDFEDRIYTEWKEGGYFTPKEGKGEPFVIVMPPPNVTGILHMGHALNNILQDVLIRYYRMTGRPTLWVPGTDHAGIATQNVVERQLAIRGLRRQDIGREAFLAETWKVKELHHGIIAGQLEKIGCSCDWSRERFTMDEGLSRAVREAFVTLYERGLVYKDIYLINYCTHCATAISDEEVEYKTVEGKLYQVAYPYADGSGSAIVATTRPETMFGDVALAVNPTDERYSAYIGRTVILPLADRPIPIIADDYVDKEFGTGMVKITPAHDPHDWEIGQRHNLEMPNILNPDGTLNDTVPKAYRGKDVLSAREMVVADLRKAGYLLSETPYSHEVGHCYRCDTIIEPYLSKQWFVAMDGMADKALQAWRDGKIHFYAKRWENTYAHWLEHIRPWCISRQLWWGHRIPVWHCRDCGHTMVLREDPVACSACNSPNIEQESDVLDTWFSSWLWPFSTLGWPDKTEDLARYFPTTTLVTGYDIIFFWVSRMIMASLEFTGDVPFRDICINGLVRDKMGRKMSKSLGNGIDPLEIVNSYGADAMKFTLCYLAALGQDILIDRDSFKLGSRFANKIWNATRFLLMNLENRNLVPIDRSQLGIMDKWMYHQINEAAATVASAIRGYRFNEATQAVYDLFWGDFCDWYLEATKYELSVQTEEQCDRLVSVMLDILATLMRLMHPFLSFITEEIYDKLPNTEGKVIIAPYPTWNAEQRNDEAKAIVESTKEFVTSIRSLRSALQIGMERKLPVVFRPDSTYRAATFITEKSPLIAALIGADPLIIDEGSFEGDVRDAIPVAGAGFEAFLFIGKALDVELEMQRLEVELSKTTELLNTTREKLANEQFLARAKSEAIEKERGKQAEFEEKIEKGTKHLAILRSLQTRKQAIS